jgi:hypothetical protein
VKYPLLAVLWLTFCHHSVATTPRPFPCDGAVHRISAEETQAIQAAAVDEMRAAIRTGTLTAPHPEKLDRDFPRVVYVACDWWGGGSLKGDPFSGWIAGQSDPAGWWIRVKTNEARRTGPLVRWETMNCYLSAIGRGDLADVWQGQVH